MPSFIRVRSIIGSKCAAHLTHNKSQVVPFADEEEKVMWVSVASGGGECVLRADAPPHTIAKLGRYVLNEASYTHSSAPNCFGAFNRLLLLSNQLLFICEHRLRRLTWVNDFTFARCATFCCVLKQSDCNQSKDKSDVAVSLSRSARSAFSKLKQKSWRIRDWRTRKTSNRWILYSLSMLKLFHELFLFTFFFLLLVGLSLDFLRKIYARISNLRFREKSLFISRQLHFESPKKRGRRNVLVIK